MSGRFGIPGLAITSEPHFVSLALTPNRLSKYRVRRKLRISVNFQSNGQADWVKLH
jgi:hypothetical protein